MNLGIYSYFFITLIACALLSRLKPIDHALQSLFDRFSSRAFPSHSPLEHNKFALIRMGLGLILVLRATSIFDLILHEEMFNPVGYWLMAEILAGVMLIFGLLTQWAILFLVFAMWHIGDYVVGKATLGNDIAAILAVLLFLTNAGKHLSLDAQLLKNNTWAHWLLLYSRHPVDQSAIFFAKFTALACYWAVCVYSIAIHLNEPAWTDGSAGPLLLSNTFMARWHLEFAALFASSELSVFLAKCSLWMMMLWYPAVLPFVLMGGWFRLYVIVWGWCFFALSLFVLQLGYLAEIEVLLWLALFWSFYGINQKNTLAVFYDDRCNLCDRTVQFITLVDIFNRIQLRPVSKNLEQLTELGVSEDEALTDLYGLRSGDQTLAKGYDFYLLLCKSIVVLWPFYPLLLLGKLIGLGPRVYRFIAARRVKLFGVCELPRQKFTQISKSDRSSATLQKTVTLHALLLIVFYFFAVPAPYVDWNGWKNTLAGSAHLYGITPINVFNKTDLRMSENWFTLDSDNFSEQVPLFAVDGSRLGLHKSDRVYFGHTLRFRRRTIGTGECQLEKWQPQLTYLAKVYLEERNAPADTYRFIYTQYQQPLVSAEDIAENRYPRQEKRILCKENLNVVLSK